MAPVNRTIREGLIVGGIAYIAVAAFYGVFDLLAARGVLFSVDLLGKAVFQGLRDPAVLGLPIQPDLAAIVQYNALHLAVSLGIGLTVTGLIGHSERHPTRARVVSLIIMSGFVVTVVAVGWLTASIRALVPWWSIVMANGLAV